MTKRSKPSAKAATAAAKKTSHKSIRSPKRYFGKSLPEVNDTSFPGRLFVVEGADGSGRSTQIEHLSAWLEASGYGVKHMGLRRSPFLAEDIEHAKSTNMLTHTTMSLFYATDFFHQLIHEIIPALRAGYIVLADRYIYTLMARDIVRGAERAWTRNLYSPSVIPDAVFYFKVDPHELAERNLQKNKTLDYWESGMDLGLSRDMFDCFLKYQQLIHNEFNRMHAEFDFQIVNANDNVDLIQLDLRKRVGALLGLIGK